MEKKKSTKLGASNRQFHTDETRIPDYERSRLQRIRENVLKMQALGLHEKAMSLMGRYQTEKGSRGKINKKKDAEEDEIYRPDQDSDIDEHEHDSSFEGTRIKETLSNQGSNSNRKKVITSNCN
ncbi:uncharacterized protein LOC110740183 [Chenopodium quinoa]|uniref:uncharacterized protein LOC110740183 n=1 Tax=Chenopodium quinoa TaxID=63459 RepID=UPI000B77AA6F|nr:uncharacterized protein LOC110740183 [Chenopodium quinoa]